MIYAEKTVDFPDVYDKIIVTKISEGRYPMKQDMQDLTSGSLWKKMLLFSLPLMASNVLQVLFNMADVAVVGQFAGSLALGAVGSTTTLVTMFTGFLIGLSGGINVLVALHLGAKSKREVEDTVHTAAIFSFVVGVLLLGLGVGFARNILELLGTKPELLEGAVLYIRIYFLGMPAMAVYNFGHAVFSAAGDTKKPLRYLMLAGAVNVVLNLFFVIVCELDVAGVALASIISQYLSAVLIVLALLRAKGDYRLQLHKLHISWSKCRDIAAIGLPAGMQNAIFQIANLFVQMGVNTFDATMVSGNSAAANADALVYDVMTAFYTACGSFMGQNYGACQKERVLKSYLVSLAYSFGIGMALGVSLVIFGEAFLGIFTSEPAVVEAGMKRLTIMGLSYGVSAFMDCTIAASRGLGKTVVPTIVVLLGSCVFRVIWVYTVFAYFGTIPSLYLLYIFSWTITAVAEIAYFVKIYRQKMAELA